MFLLNWLRSNPKPNTVRRASTFHATLEGLENRIVPTWAGQLGGVGEDWIDVQNVGRPITDGAGNTYLVGKAAAGADLDPGPGVALHAGGNFLARYSPTADGGLQYLWSRSLYTHPTEDSNYAASVAADGTSVYVAGSFIGTHDFGGGFSLTTPSASRSAPPRPDAYVLRLDAATGTTLWARQIGGTGTERARDAATDGANVYVVGEFSTIQKETADFDPDPTRSRLLKPRGGDDGFLLRLTASGGFANVTQIGGSGADEVNRVVTAGGAVYVTGTFDGTVDFDPTRSLPANADVRTTSGKTDQFFARYDPAGTLGWTQSIGSAAYYDYRTTHLAVDAAHVYLATEVYQATTSDVPAVYDFDPGAGTAAVTSNGLHDVVVAKYSAATGALARATDGIPWVRQFGGAGDEYVYAIRVAADGTILLSGSFLNDVDFGGGAFTKIAGEHDGYVLRLNTDGTYRQAWQIDGFAHVTGVVDGRMFVVGNLPRQMALPTGDTLTPAGGNDIFLMILDLLTAS
jgi:hypothetical protein